MSWLDRPIPKVCTTRSGVIIDSLDDVPEIAGLAARQLVFTKWYKVIGLVPFTIFLGIGLRYFPDSSAQLFVALLLASLGWAIVVAVYSLYLLLFLACPACDQKIGTGASCSSCGLPRHRL